MAEKKENERMIWSCAMLDMPPEEETARLEELLQQRELPFWEDARMLQGYLRRTGLSQALCARRLGRSQAAVANRLRLLKLPEDVVRELTAAGLTERHARALLRLPSAEEQRRVLRTLLRQKLTVAETEDYVDRLLTERQSPAEEAFAPLLKVLGELRDAVPGVYFTLEEDESGIDFRIRLPKEKIP